ncbi:predicted protein [Naegleria gruberi]|uniref:Predicted protein n=1 Tax=Naegleria gruberi TaxID=5762 RepID=D2VTY5_NAEGR|nr:uncharacterized protein NAEGRDRAFT_72473 [Naegleria gruberi]EFC39801.1 predicted protein [Naegleria gruberi]|eukprot:XP_002672545.1 predicted protein [Naegleria gruberi strain NEG-M]
MIEYLAGVLLLLIGVIGLNVFRYLEFEKERKRVNSEECLSNRHIIITGASSGIGEQLLRHYCTIGKRNKIVITARNVEKLQELKEIMLKEYSGKGHEIFCVKTDVSVDEECKNLIELSAKYLNERIDVIYLNAGRSAVQMFAQATNLDGHRSLMETNFFGCVTPTFYLMKHLREKQESHCSICVVSSLAGLSGVCYRTAYSSSKFALHGFYEALKLELLKEGIYGKKVTISIVCPGFVKTQIHFNALGTENKSASNVKRDLSQFMEVDECVSRMVTNVEGKNGDFLFIVPYTERFLIQYFRPWMPAPIIEYILLKKGDSVQIE